MTNLHSPGIPISVWLQELCDHSIQNVAYVMKLYTLKVIFGSNQPISLLFEFNEGCWYM